MTVAFSPDSRLLLTASLDNRLHVWDTATGHEIQQLIGHAASVWYMEFSPDGKYIISSSQDFNVFVWDWQIGEVVRQFSVEQFGPAGTTAGFSRDGQSIYLQSADSGIVIHELALMLKSGELLEWVQQNRHIRDLTCGEHELYRVEPLCDTEISMDPGSAG